MAAYYKTLAEKGPAMATCGPRTTRDQALSAVMDAVGCEMTRLVNDSHVWMLLDLGRHKNPTLWRSCTPVHIEIQSGHIPYVYRWTSQSVVSLVQVALSSSTLNHVDASQSVYICSPPRAGPCVSCAAARTASHTNKTPSLTAYPTPAPSAPHRPPPIPYAPPRPGSGPGSSRAPQPPLPPP